MSEANKKSGFTHWPVIILALLVVSIFVVAMVTFQVKETEYAILKTFGKPKVDAAGKIIEYAPGLHFRRPFIDQVWRHDKRLQCYELSKGKHEQITTKDQYQIVVSTFVLWRVGDPGLFLRRMKSTAEAEKNLESVVRNSRAEVIPQHNFSELVNVNSSESKMKQIEDEMLSRIKATAMKEYGIEVTKLGFRQLGFPEAVSSKVFDRMRAERASKSEKYLAEGKSEAQRIRSEADRKANAILAEAEAEAKRIRGQGDEAAAKHYAVFSQNPELAKFLRSLEALKISLGANDTLILDTETPPFTLFKAGATELKGSAATK
ncbi:MAG: protease modulator HflC [Oligosphaeraceae bacterium]|nr:protease modulator HflC [Oligosphaeraceae bacterium]